MAGWVFGLRALDASRCLKHSRCHPRWKGDIRCHWKAFGGTVLQTAPAVALGMERGLREGP